MRRSVDRSDGLALLGSATVGPLVTPTPALLESEPPRTDDGLLSLRSEPAPPGRRRLVVSDAAGQLELDLPILAPEVTGAPPGGTPVGERTVLVHAPLAVGAAPSPGAGSTDLVVLGNARALWSDGLPFVRALGELRRAFGAAPIVWAPRVALPHRLPLLAYLGVDWADSTEGLLAAARGEFLDPTLGSLDPGVARREHLCACPACASDPPGPLAVHTVHAFRRAIAETRTAARLGRLRELVEARLPTEPVLAEMLRYADRELGSLLEERTPVTGEGTRSYVVAESLRRPEMLRFRRRLLERYRPPLSKTVLLLLPCSKTKPYRRSRSHRRFATAWEGLAGTERLHVVSVSSPIGVVPRELEDVPPARHYDIPVTGEWAEAERAAVGAGIRHLLAHGAYRSVVVHLDPEEYSFVRSALDGASDVTWSARDDHVTNADGVRHLRDALVRALGPAAPVSGGPLAVVREELREVASVQFGRAAADRLFAPPIRLAGRPWFQRLTDGRTELATLREERGLFHLTLAGARRLGTDPPLCVDVDPGLALSGDLFVPGVRAADPEIRAGDSVVLRRGGELAAVGEAELPGPLMTTLGHGRAVRVRHRAHGPTDTPMTEEEPDSGPGPVV